MKRNRGSPSPLPLLITGGEGMLGSEFAAVASHASQFETRALGRGALDVRDADAMAAMQDWVAGGWVVHCAATVDVEGCAKDPSNARKTIVDGAINAANLAKLAGAQIFFPQSFLIYDGKINPIPEHELPRPLSLYGSLKWEAEQEILSRVDQALVVRMAGFFGGASKDKNFVGRIIPHMHAAVLSGRKTFEVGDRVWQPTWTRDLAENAVELIKAGATGRYQMACRGSASFHEVASEIVVALGWADRLTIVPADSAQVSQSELGRRPDNAILTCDRLKDEALDLQRDWRSTLHAYLRHDFFNQYRLEVLP